MKEKYGMDEEDFMSSESLKLYRQEEQGNSVLTESMIMCYGQDDRVCAYTSLAAMLGTKAELERTACCLLVDKEEIGSVGATGMQLKMF